MFLWRISAEIQFLVKDSDVVGSRTIEAVGVQVEKLARECNQQQADSGSGYYVMRWMFFLVTDDMKLLDGWLFSVDILVVLYNNTKVFGHLHDVFIDLEDVLGYHRSLTKHAYKNKKETLTMEGKANEGCAR
ncbi:hypothetical protein Tco_0580497 [Tanacetum coccineum]